MGKIKVAINGFGRIGRVTFRAIQAMDSIEIIAINDLTNAGTMAHLLKYDSIHGIFDGTIQTEGDRIIVNGKKVQTYNERSPKDLPWKELGIDVVLESTGLFKDEASASLHLKAGAKRVIISAPPGSGNIKSVVLGINDDILAGD